MITRSVVVPTQLDAEDSAIISLRPKYLSEFSGQQKIKDNLKVFIEAAKLRRKSLDHTLFYGPPGLGKTTLASIIATELGVGFRVTTGPMISKAGDLAAILTNLSRDDVLFIDEIHRLPITVEETLYSAMEDFRLDIIVGDGPAARTIKIDLNPFTLIGATTRAGLLSNPLRGRFGIVMPLEPYTKSELSLIVRRYAHLDCTTIDDDAAMLIAERSRGTPRIAIRIAKRVSDFALLDGASLITSAIVNKATDRLEIDRYGLDSCDIKYLKFILNHYNGGPVGIETIAAGLCEDRGSIEEVVEPFLIQDGFISRTTRGRILTEKAYLHLERYK